MARAFWSRHTGSRCGMRLSYPTEALPDGSHGGFTVDVQVHVAVPGTQPVAGTLSVAGSWGGNAQQAVTLGAGVEHVLTISINATAQQVLRPVAMYTCHVTYNVPQTQRVCAAAARRARDADERYR
jgi:hypothetical protein